MVQKINVRKIVLVIAAIVGFSIFAVGCGDSSDNNDSTPSPKTYTLGALVPETGDASEVGAAVKAAIELAVEDVNVDHAQSGIASNITLKAYDTASDFIIADEGIRKLKEDNVSLVIGPVLSASSYFIKDTAAENNMLLISPSASAASLAIPDDNLMRLVLDDSFQAEALVSHMIDQGITKLAVFVLMDDYGQGLLTTISDKFQSAGGEFIAVYNMRGAYSEESIRSQLSDLASVVEGELAATDESSIGVLMVLYQLGVTVMQYAGEYQYLGNIRWFGTDALAQNTMITEDQAVGSFAEKVNFTCTAMSKLNFNQEKSDALETRIMARTGLGQVSVYGILAYDSAMLAAQALVETDGSADPAVLRQKIRDLTATYDGPSSPIVLNEADDRSSPTHFDLWRVQGSGIEYTWVRDSYGTP